MIRDPRVMIINQDPNTGYYLSRAFLKSGYSAQTYANRDEAALNLNRFQPDVIVMNYIMPGLTTEVFMAMCRSELPAAKVILIADSKDAQTIAERFSAEAFFAQPIVIEALVEYANKLNNHA